MNQSSFFTAFSLAALGAVALAACGQTVALEDRPCPCTADWTCCTASNVCVAPGNACPGGAAPDGGTDATFVTSDASTTTVSDAHDASVDPNTWAQECADPNHGDPDPFTDAPSLTARLVARWYSCDYGTTPDLYGSQKAIEFDNDNTWHALAIAGDGTVTALSGLGNQGTWHPQAAPSTYVDVDTDGGDTISEMEFEKGPRRMKITVATEGAQLWFVPMN